MFAAALICETDGSFTCIGETIAECKAAVKSQSDKFHGSYLACTLPFAIYEYNISLPEEVKRSLSPELLSLYLVDA